MFFLCSETLFVGEHKYGLFAMPSLMDKSQTLTIRSVPPGRRLIEGPKRESERNSNDHQSERSCRKQEECRYDIPEISDAPPTAVGQVGSNIHYYRQRLVLWTLF